MAIAGNEDTSRIGGEKKSQDVSATIPKRKSTRGFASMSAERQREIARKGGKAAHEKGTAHEFTPDEARVAGRKGGEAVSRDRKHMAEIGREGGQARGLRASQRRRQAEQVQAATGVGSAEETASPSSEAQGQEFGNVTRADFGGQTSHDSKMTLPNEVPRETGT
jgi:uncharacterized protein